MTDTNYDVVRCFHMIGIMGAYKHILHCNMVGVTVIFTKASIYETSNI